MSSVAPMPQSNLSGNIDAGRPGQQLLPGYVVKLLKTLKIPFGTDRSMSGVDVDPSIALVSHIIDCLGALRDINKVYRAKGSLASRSVGTRFLFGFSAELGNLLLDSLTFDPPLDLELAAQATPSTGKILIHHAALKSSSAMTLEALKMIIKAYPAGAWTADKSGALALHWITHNPNCNQDFINFLVNANPKAPWMSDNDGYLPLHWAVNQDQPNIDVVASLLAVNASASSKPCLKGSLPLHWAVNRDSPSIPVMKALLQVYPDAVRTFDKTGWLPVHQLVNRSDVSIEALKILIEMYPQGLQCPNVNGQLPLHRALDQNNPSYEAVSLLLEAFPGGAKVADDEGYLPIHLALDCSRPNVTISRLLLESYPEAAFHKSKDGLLPIHCVISSVNPVVEIIQMLLNIFPDSSESMAIDVLPADEFADPENWKGDWIEKRWTPLSRAIDRNLDAIVVLFRDALNHKHTRSGATMKNPHLTMATNASYKALLPQSKPPLNSTPSKLNAASMSDDQNPPLSVPRNMNFNQEGLRLGGSLDGPSQVIDESAEKQADEVLAQDMHNMSFSNHMGPQANPPPSSSSPQYPLQHQASRPFPMGDPDEHQPPNSSSQDLRRINSLHPMGAAPPPVLERAPGGSVVMRSAKNAKNNRSFQESPMRPSKNRSSSKDRRAKSSSRLRDGRDGRDPRDPRDDRDDREYRDRHRRGHSSSRNRDRDRARDRDRRSHRHRRHRDYEYDDEYGVEYVEEEGDSADNEDVDEDSYYQDPRRHSSRHDRHRSSSRMRAASSRGQMSRRPVQRIYDNPEMDDRQYMEGGGMEAVDNRMPNPSLQPDAVAASPMSPQEQQYYEQTNRMPSNQPPRQLRDAAYMSASNNNNNNNNNNNSSNNFPANYDPHSRDANSQYKNDAVAVNMPSSFSQQRPQHPEEMV